MARLTRITNILFGSTASGTDIEQFGSAVQLGIPNYTTNPGTIQALSAWTNGWSAALVVANQSAYKQDMNALHYVLSYQLGYLLQQGIPEWDASTVYYASPNPSIVQYNGGQLYQSLQDSNTGNAPPASASNAFWKWINQPPVVDGGVSVNSVPRVSAINPAVVVNGALTDDGVNVKTTLPLKFPDNTVQSTAAVNAAVSVQNVVTGSRGLGTVFHNTGSKPLFVSVSMSLSGATNASVKSDASVTPTTVVAAAGAATGLTSVSFVVLPGNYYSVSLSGAGSLFCWTEWS